MATATLVINADRDIFIHYDDQAAMLGLAEFDALVNADDELAEAFGPAAVAEAQARRLDAEHAVLDRVATDPDATGHAAVLAVTALARLRREANDLSARLRTATAAFDALAERAAIDKELAVADALASHGIKPDFGELPNFLART